MKMESALPFIAMVIQQIAQVGLMVASKVVSSDGLTAFTFVFYSSFLSTVILIPFSYFLHRSALPPLWPTFVRGFFLLGVMGSLMQVLIFVGLQYSSPLLSTAMLQLIPGFTFVLAVLLRMESFECKSLRTVAKTIGTLVSILGALVATLYKGPGVLNSSLTTPHHHHHFLNQSSTWIIGGFLVMTGALIASVFVISQAYVLLKYPAELIVMLFYAGGVTVLCLVASLITQALFGSVFQTCITSWCVKKRGPLFVVMFHPLGVVIAMVASLFVGETIYVGSVVGSVIIVLGFYSVIWGKAKEWKKKEKNFESNNNKKMPLLQDKADDPEVNL